MKNLSGDWLFASKQNFAALLFMLLPMAFAFSNAPLETVGCEVPVNISLTAQTGTSVTYSWDEVPGASGYFLISQKIGESSPDEFYAIGTSYTFSNLSTGTYQFSIGTDCGAQVSEIIVLDEMVME